MKIRYFLLAIIIFYNFRSFACGNEYETTPYTKVDGSVHELEYDGWMPYHFNNGFDTVELNVKRIKLEKQIKKTNSYKDKSDFALVLLKLGKYEKSLKILQGLIKQHPWEYNIVANLGTAYELNGNVDSALFYIRRGVEINPGSHKSSEWIHVKILEAKKKMRNDKDYLRHHSILGLKLDEKILSGEMPDEMDLEQLSEIREQLRWQLEERTAFVASPDEVVADLMFDMANLVALTYYLESSIEYYDLSLKYKPANLQLVLDVKDEVSSDVGWTKIKSYKWVFVITIISIILLMLIWMIIRIEKRSRMKKLGSLTNNRI